MPSFSSKKKTLWNHASILLHSLHLEESPFVFGDVFIKTDRLEYVECGLEIHGAIFAVGTTYHHFLFRDSLSTFRVFFVMIHIFNDFGEMRL